MKTIHLIFNAHLDPIWLWPWHAGMAEVLATARSVCDQLDECEDLIFTRGESWFYQQVEDHDLQLFDRITQHIANSRWEIVGGWYIQPDCNFPAYHGLEKHIEIGHDYFTRTFKQFPDIAYNVDTFGHAATLPRLMHDSGQRYYIMMRPQESEMALPARLFRWQGETDGPTITTFRIANSYCTQDGFDEKHVLRSLTQLPDGIEHTMCFVGLGDHGGGPSRAMTQWCREHAHAFDGVELVFSSPSKFFAAIAADLDKLPLVQGELQHHAVGCYSVDRKTKVLVRQAEQTLRGVEAVKSIEDKPAVKQAWEHTCFHHFHDTIGGTCIPTAYPIVHAQLGSALTTTDRLLRHETMQRALALSADLRQRIVLFNPSPLPFDGYVEVEPWLDWQTWQPHWQLEHEDGTPICHQIIDSEALTQRLTRVLFACKIPSRDTFVAHINPTPTQNSSAAQCTTPAVAHEGLCIGNSSGNSVSLGLHPTMMLNGITLSLPRLCLQHDTTDTWSHGITRYDEPIADHAQVQHTVVTNSGPLMAQITQYGRIGQSKFEAQWRVYANQPSITLDLHVQWVEEHRVLKLVWDMPTRCTSRLEGIPGSVLHRASDRRERPVRDLTQLHLEDGSMLGIACPDIFALDGSENDVRLTLLRSSIMAHHQPHNGIAAQRRFSDRGTHDFHFVFSAGKRATIEALEQQATQHWLQPMHTDLTRGMPPRGLERYQ